MAQQLGLFASADRVFVDDGRTRIAYYPQLLDVHEAAELFGKLEGSLNWTQESMWMYDHTVTVPRLIARFAPGHALPGELLAAKARVERFLDTAFNAVSVQYYRNGSDSVAWHSDHTEDLIDGAIVALVSLGAAREMQIRRKTKPRRAFSVDLEPGSLLVMAGDAQQTHEHHIPKVARPLGPRMSIALRQAQTKA